MMQNLLLPLLYFQKPCLPVQLTLSKRTFWLCTQHIDLMVQFHAVALLHALRAGDRLAVSKLVTSLTQKNVRSSLAQCLLVRWGMPASIALTCAM